MSRLSMIVQYVRSVERAAGFYSQGLGCQVRILSDTVAEVDDQPPIVLRQADSEALLSTAYSPCLTFLVADLDEVLPRTLQLGATMDGAIVYSEKGKRAMIRSPDGLMIGLTELAPVGDPAWST